MQSKREQVFVGLFVLIAVAVLFGTVFAMSGAYGRSTTKFHAYFPFAGGLEPGATVRYAGGPKVGRVDSVQLDPKDAARLELNGKLTATQAAVQAAQADTQAAKAELAPLLPAAEKRVVTSGMSLVRWSISLRKSEV